MPTPTTYSYAIENLLGGSVHPGQLKSEIESDPGITLQVSVSANGSVSQGGVVSGPGTLDVTFADVLALAQQTILDGGLVLGVPNDPPTAESLLGQHSPQEKLQTVPVAEQNAPLRRPEDGAIYAVPKPSLLNSVMNDRDFRVNTSTFDGPSSFEDLKVNPATNKEEPWGEMSLHGVFKDDGGGNMVACTDQADADANCILSAWDYSAKLPVDQSLVTYELRDGILYVDPGLFANPAAPTEQERFGSRAYAVLVPDVPGDQGGSIAVFDGYLGSNTKSMTVEAMSPQASVLDPNGPAGAAGVVLRLFIFHPPGQKLSHVMRLVMYRQPGTF